MDSQSEALEIVEAPEAEPRKRRKSLTEGEKIVHLIKGCGVKIPADFEADISEIPDEIGMQAYLRANLDASLKPDRMMAMSIFGHWIHQRIPLQELLTVQQLYCIEQAKSCIDDANRILATSEKTLADGTKVTLSYEHELAANRMKLMAADRMAAMIARAQKAASTIKLPTELPKPKNRAPDVLNQVNVRVESSQPGVTIAETKHST